PEVFHAHISHAKTTANRAFTRFFACYDYRLKQLFSSDSDLDLWVSLHLGRLYFSLYFSRHRLNGTPLWGCACTPNYLLRDASGTPYFLRDFDRISRWCVDGHWRTL